MGCGCRNKGVRNVRTTAGGRPIVTPRQASIQGPALTPRQQELKAQSVQSQSQSQGLTTEMRQREKQRREALLKKLGRL